MTIQIVSPTSKASSTSPKATASARLVNDEPTSAICRNLTSLTQPRFFCGQLLTDQDLTMLLSWAQDKFRLNRYRDGWGVACGLAVQGDPDGGAHVVVTPGYALDCCGNDIIVSQAIAVDLSDACRGGKGRCGDLSATSGSDSNAGKSFPFLGLNTPVGEVRALDLFIHYQESPSDPQTALGRTVCREAGECDYSRTKEAVNFTLECQPGAAYTDPTRSAVDEWKREYDKCSSELLSALNREFPTLFSEGTLSDKGQKERQWLVDHWIAEHPLTQFCFIRDWLAASKSTPWTLAGITRVLFLLTLDHCLHYLSNDCHDNLPHCGVPLARIWVNIPEQRGNSICQVLSIDPAPPYRRLLSRENWPASPGYVNLGQVIWRQWPEARAALAELGLRVRNVIEAEVPSAPAELEDWLPKAESLIALSNSEVTVRLLTVRAKNGAPEEQRVIGFTDLEAENGPPEEEEPAADDLTKIDGIGQRRAEILRENDITSFEALINTPNDRLRELFRGVTETEVNSWKVQARELMKG